MVSAGGRTAETDEKSNTLGGRALSLAPSIVCVWFGVKLSLRWLGVERGKLGAGAGIVSAGMSSAKD